MAEIQPFRAWRYGNQWDDQIAELTSPLFDVVSERQRTRLYENPVNSIHLSVPQGPDVVKNTSALLSKWKNERTVERDPLPGIYVYYQYFSLPGIHKQFCRKGFICNIRVYDWDEKMILRHENTMPGAVNDRIDVLSATQMNISPTHGLYTDERHELERYMDESMKHPIYDIEDYQGVRDVLSVIHDRDVIQKFVDVIGPKKIILADGHHRYAGALQYKNQKADTPTHPANFHMMYLTNTESDDLRILPTHRLLKNLEGFSKEHTLERLKEFFNVTVIDEPQTAMELIAGKPATFAMLLPGEAYKLQLKDGLSDKVPWNFDSLVNQLDISLLHYYILDRSFDIPGRTHTRSPHIQFDRSFTDSLTLVEKGAVQAAIITNDIAMEDIKKVCYSGSVMPQKSTFFYPKVVCGFVFSSIDYEEFSENNPGCF